MQRQKTITKTDLLWKAIREDLLHLLWVDFFTSAFVFICFALNHRYAQSAQLVYMTVLVFIMFFVVSTLGSISNAALSLRLLDKQEKVCHFSFADEKLTWETIPADWYINCESSTVIAVRRGYITEAGEPEEIKHESNRVRRMKVKDIAGEIYYIKGKTEQIEGLKKWLNAETDQKTQSSSK